MPRIPDYSAAGTSTARSNTPRFPVDRSAAIEAEGQQALLGAVTGVVQQVEEHDDKLRYAAARSTLLQAQVEARKELEGDTNYETYEKRFRDRTAKARSEAAAKIRGTRSRELFEIDAQADIERGVEQVRGLARAREVDEGIATVNANLEANRTAALESKDPVERGALVQSSLDMIDGLFRKGFIKETQAVAEREKFKASYAEGFVGIQQPAERIKLLEDPDKSVAKFIAPDRRKVLLEAAKKDNDEARVRGESQALFDGYVEKYGTNYNAAIKAARAELKADPLVRDATEQRLKEEQQRTEFRQRQEREDAFGKAVEFVDGGGSYEDAPKKGLTPQQRSALRTYAEGGGANARLVSDRETVTKLQKLFQDAQLTDAGAKAFAKVEVDEYKALLTSKDEEEWRQRVTDARAGKFGGKDVGLQTILQQREATIKELQKAGELKKPEEIDYFNSQLDARLKAYQEANGGKPAGSDEARTIINTMKAEVVLKEGTWGFGRKSKRAYKLTEEDMGDVSIPKADREAIIEVLREQGKPITPRAIEDAYNYELFRPRK